MLGLNSSPNITHFAEYHGVTRDSVVSLMRLSFGNHIKVLKSASAEFQQDSTLRITSDMNRNDYMTLDVKQCEFPVIEPIDESVVLGFLTPISEDDTHVYMLVTI